MTDEEMAQVISLAEEVLQGDKSALFDDVHKELAAVVIILRNQNLNAQVQINAAFHELKQGFEKIKNEAIEQGI